MTAQLNIRCQDLGIDHPGSVSGTSLGDLIDCIEQQLRDEAGLSPETVSEGYARDLIRSAVLQSSRPSSTRSVRLSRLIA